MVLDDLELEGGVADIIGLYLLRNRTFRAASELRNEVEHERLRE
jgi:hypothetical protein